MKCPFCGGLDDKVLESRQNSSGTTIRRRRECTSCAYRFTSYERIEEVPLKVVKRDGRREPFDIQKLARGIHRALEKRPVPHVDIERMLNAIEDEAAYRGRSSHEIPAEELGEMVLEKLFGLDRVAYVRFASVYRKFEEVEEFINVIEDLGRGRGTPQEN